MSLSNEVINNIIIQVFPNYENKPLLVNIISTICNAIRTYFFDNNNDIFLKVVKCNNYRNIKSIIISIFYYLETDNYKKFKKFSSFFDEDMTNILRENSHIQYKGNNKYFADFSNKIGIDDSKYLINISKLLICSIIRMSNKLYVNWINVQPISFEEIIKTDYFANTNETYIKSIYTDDIDDYLKNNTLDVEYNYKNRLYIGEIYNTIRNFLYEKIKFYKLMIFFYEKNGKLIQYYDRISNFFDFKTNENIFTKYYDYKLLPIEFKNKFKNFSLYLSKLIYINNENKIFSEDDLKLYFGTYYFLQLPYEKILEKDIQLYKNLQKSLHNKEDNEDNEYKVFVKNLDNEKLNQIYNVYINNDTYISEFYKFIQKQIIGYLSTVYAQNIIKKNDFQPKIFYNYFKLWVIKPNQSKLELLPKEYEHLTEEQKMSFINKINGKEEFNFIIPNIIRKSNNLIKKKEYGNYINNEFILIIYNSLIREGILSKIVYNPRCVEQSLVGENDKFIKRNMREEVFTPQNKERFNKCYYYLGNESYENIKIPNYKLNRDLSLYEHLSHKDYGIIPPYYTQFALNWVSQLFLYFKFLNCRVLYVTGATGVGKSTQVPKLLMYALKAFSFKVDGKVICTQPRVDPTVGIAEQVSRELGLPIVSSDMDGNKIMEPSLNKYIQYQHKKNKIVDNYTPYYLKFVTDGLFFEQVINNIPLKEETKISIKLNEQRQNKYTVKNIYDVVVVDEAHEHNKNMDYILSVIRNSLYYNNDLKLVIVSATMEDDEKFYRYYYRHIDDNLKYPLSNIVLKYKLTRFFIDRRIHIEPPPMPGKSSTKFPIKDIFLEEDTDYEEAEKQSIITINNICNESTDGHILLFTTGKREIEFISRELSNILPSNVFIFPYFADMPNADKYKDDVKKIDSRLKNYKIDRLSFIDFMFGVIKETDIEKNNINYSRAVIIATNVAEASITIPNLQYVVDIGYYNFVGYDYNSRLPIIRKEKIDDNSRKQRRGRTGRTNAGTVYYMYKKGGRENIKTIKSIESSNITFDYLKFLPNDNNEKLFFVPEFDPYYSIFFNKSKEDVIDFFKNRKGYDDVIKTQFLYENQLLGQDNIQFREEYLRVPPYQENKKKIFDNILQTDFKVLYTYKEKGFEPKTIIDNYGLFFINHPEENNIIRLNSFPIIKYRNNKNDSWKNFNKPDDIKFPKMEIIFNNLVNYSFLIKKNIFDYTKTEFIKYFSLVGRTKLDFMVDKVTNSSELLSIVYLASKLFKSSDNVLLIICLLKSCLFNIRSLVDSKMVLNSKTNKMQKVFDVDKFKNNINYNHQLIQLLNISEQIIDKLNSIINKELRKNSLFINFKSLNQIDSFTNKNYNQIIVTRLVNKFYDNKYYLSFEDRKLFNKVIKESDDKEIENHEYLKTNIDLIIDKFIKNNKYVLDNIAKDIGISTKIIPSFLKDYINNFIYNYYDKNIKENIDNELVKKHSFILDKKSAILNSFLTGFKLNKERLSGEETDFVKTKDGFTNISISSDSSFFYLTKAILSIIKDNKQQQIKVYSILNRLNFNIIDLKYEFNKKMY